MATYRYPNSPVLYRRLTHTYPLAVRGKGCWLYDAAGKAYLDACGGAFVANVGHGVVEIAEAIARQARQLAYVNGTAFTHEPVEQLATAIAQRSPRGLDKVYVLSSGSEAVEAALKLARQYWVERGQRQKHVIIALRPSYHGNTLLALSASAREHYRSVFCDWLVDVRRVPAPFAYRCRCGGTDAGCPVCSGSALERAILEAGPETVAAFIAEPVGGSSTGASVPRSDYFRRVRDTCDRHEVLLIADEVLTGVGRTGTWTALEQFDVAPDLMIVGKGLGGGVVPLSAVVTSERILDSIADGAGGLLHAQTFSHHPVCCAAGVAVLTYLEAHGLIERCGRMGTLLHHRLHELRDAPAVGDVRGRGLLAGIEFVADKDSRAPFPRATRFAERFTSAAIAEGLVVWPNVGHVDGERGDLVCLAPPFVVTESEIDEIIIRFRRALDAALAAIGTISRRRQPRAS